MKIRVVLLCATMIACASSGFADPIVITQGSVDLGPAFDFEPPYGVGLQGAGTQISGVDFQSSRFVTLGQTVDLSQTVSITSFGFGDQTVEGVHYSDVIIRGALTFTAQPITVTDFSSSFGAPFTMTGVVSLFEAFPGFPGPLLLTRTLSGSGSARLFVDHARLDGSASTFATFSFSPEDASPTPEPGTLLLLTAALASAWLTATGRARSA